MFWKRKKVQIPPAPLTEERRKLDNIWLSFFVMGRDPVERAKYKPLAMRVRGVCYTKKTPFRYNFGCSSLNYNERKGDSNGQQGK